jgi:hypothetical protein
VLSTKAILSAFASVLLAAVCAAQTPEDVRRDAQIRLGPLYATPRFPMKEFGVDTNVFNNADAKRDFTFTFAPQADLWVPFGRRALVTTGVATDLVYYQTYSSERSINPDVHVRADAYLGRITPFAEAGYLRTRQRPNFEIDVRSLRQERTAALGADLRVAGKLSVELVGHYRDLSYDPGASFNQISLRESLNRETTTLSVESRYAATPLTTFLLRVEAGTDRFEFSPVRNADSIRVTPGVEFKPLALVSGSARVGVRRFDPESPALEPFAGVVAAATLSYTLQGTMRFTVTADRDLTYSYERTQPYFVVDGIGLTVRRQLVGAFDVTAGVQRQKYSYRSLLLPGITVVDPDRVDVTRSWSGSLGYRLGGSMRAGFGAAFRERRTTDPRYRDYSGFRFITTLDYEL